MIRLTDTETVMETHLGRHDLSLETVKESLLKLDPSASFVLWSSYLDQLGTPRSDVDVYQVVSQGASRATAEVVEFGSLTLDIEKIDYRLLAETVERLVRFTGDDRQDRFISLDKLKMVDRMKRGYLFNAQPGFSNLIDRIDMEQLRQAIAHTCHLDYLSEYEDAMRFYQDRLNTSAYQPALSSLYKSLGVFCAEKNRPLTKPKWYYRVFEELLGEDHPLVSEYWQVQGLIGAGLSVDKAVEKILRLSQKIIMESTQEH